MKPIALASLFFLATTGSAQSQASHDFDNVAKIVGKAGTLNADGSYRINLARTDVSFKNLNGMSIPADLGLSTYIAFSSASANALAVGDVAMLQPEVDGVIDALREGGFEIVALHNHMSSEEPRLFYMHFQVTGNPVAIATTFKSAIALLGKMKPVAAPQKAAKPKLDGPALEAIFKSKAQVFPSGVLRFASPRKDLAVKVNDIKFSPGMGLASWCALYACDCGLTMAMGDTCCTRSELQGAIDAYRKAGIHITGIHNHTFGASTEIMFMHYEAEGDFLSVAGGVKACWDSLGAK